MVIARRGRVQALAVAGGLLLLVVAPVALERSQIFADVTAGMFVLLWVGCGLLLRMARRRGLTNAVLALVIVAWPSYARVVRSLVLSVGDKAGECVFSK